MGRANAVREVAVYLARISAPDTPTILTSLRSADPLNRQALTGSSERAKRASELGRTEAEGASNATAATRDAIAERGVELVEVT
jgi:hypothetical protein